MVSSQVLRRDCTRSKRISWRQIERKKTYGNIAAHCAGCLNFHEPVHIRLFHCWKMWGFRELSSSVVTVHSCWRKQLQHNEWLTYWKLNLIWCALGNRSVNTHYLSLNCSHICSVQFEVLDDQFNELTLFEFTFQLVDKCVWDNML